MLVSPVILALPPMKTSCAIPTRGGNDPCCGRRRVCRVRDLEAGKIDLVVLATNLRI